MGRASGEVLEPIELILRFSRYHESKTHTGNTHQLYFFSKDVSECNKLLTFGGGVYRQIGGYCWMCGKRKELVAVYKLFPPTRTLSTDMKKFEQWVQTQLLDF